MPAKYVLPNLSIGNANIFLKNTKKVQDPGFEPWSSKWEISLLPLSHAA